MNKNIIARKAIRSHGESYGGSTRITFRVFYFMRLSIISGLKNDALEIQRVLNIPYDEAFKLAIEIWRAQSLDSIAYFLRQDGEFQESMSNISNAIKDIQ
jgi:hypothetical protein